MAREAGMGHSPQWARASLAVASVLWNLVELVVEYFEADVYIRFFDIGSKSFYEVLEGTSNLGSP